MSNSARFLCHQWLIIFAFKAMQMLMFGKSIAGGIAAVVDPLTSIRKTWLFPRKYRLMGRHRKIARGKNSKDSFLKCILRDR